MEKSESRSWRDEFRDLAWRIADKARFHGVSHHVSADRYQRMDTFLTYTSIFLGACSTVGAGSLLTDYTNESTSRKQKAVIFSAGASLIQAVITTLNNSHYSPRTAMDDHRRAASELQDFREKLNVWYRVDLDRPDLTVEIAKKEYERFLDEKKRIESEYVKSENWTFLQVNAEISHSDTRREKASKK